MGNDWAFKVHSGVMASFCPSIDDFVKLTFCFGVGPNLRLEHSTSMMVPQVTEGLES